MTTYKPIVFHCTNAALSIELGEGEREPMEDFKEESRRCVGCSVAGSDDVRDRREQFRSRLFVMILLLVMPARYARRLASSSRCAQIDTHVHANAHANAHAQVFLSGRRDPWFSLDNHFVEERNQDTHRLVRPHFTYEVIDKITALNKVPIRAVSSTSEETVT